MKEKEVQKAILEALTAHPAVAWAYITSCGTVRGVGGGRPFNIGFNGLSDIVGQLTTGQILAVEVKIPGKEPTFEQCQFIDKVNANGGVAFWSDSVEKAVKSLESTL